MNVPFLSWLPALLAAACFSAAAQEYPSKTVRVIVQVPPGAGPPLLFFHSSMQATLKPS